MIPCPNIVVYESTYAPASHRFQALFFTSAGKSLPLVFFAAERDAVIGSASSWWAEDQARLAKKQADNAARSARMRKAP